MEPGCPAHLVPFAGLAGPESEGNEGAAGLAEGRPTAGWTESWEAVFLSQLLPCATSSPSLAFWTLGCLVHSKPCPLGSPGCCACPLEEVPPSRLYPCLPKSMDQEVLLESTGGRQCPHPALDACSQQQMCGWGPTGPRSSPQQLSLRPLPQEQQGGQSPGTQLLWCPPLVPLPWQARVGGGPEIPVDPWET